MPTDAELLRQYVKDGSEAAFTEIVQRHAGLVYSVAWRLAGGNRHLAKDITQDVFILLAQKAPKLIGHETLAGWLHTTTRYAANGMIRSLRRQENREQEAVAMETNSAPDVQWEQLRPLLDEAVGRLGDRDRNAVLLRYYEGKNYREVGAALCLSENSARARTERAVEKLRRQFARNGVVTTGALLAEALMVNTAQAAPAGLAKEVAAMAHAQGLSPGPVLPKALYMTTKTKLILATTLALILLGIFIRRPASPSRPAASEPAQPVIAQTPAAPRLSAQAAKPAAPPAATLSPADAQKKEILAELKTLLSNMAQSLRTGELVYDYYLPDDLPRRGFTPERIATSRALTTDVLNNSSSIPKDIMISTKNLMESQALSYEALEDQIPAINAKGDEATYQYVQFTPDDMKHGMFTENAAFSGKGNKAPLTFVKVQGQWYFKPVPDAEAQAPMLDSISHPFAQ